MTRRGSLVLLLPLLASCEHTPPFAAGPVGVSGALAGGTPTRLTYNPGDNDRAGWLPDGSGFLYTQERLDLPNDERCLARMPAHGGTVTLTICGSLEASQDSQLTFESPAVSQAGALAYLRAGTINVGATGFDANALLLSSLAAPESAVILQRVPFFGPNGRPVDNLSQLQWLDDTSLIVLGEREVFPTCLGCLPDTIRSGIEIDRVNVGAGGVHVVAIPQTDQASSFSVANGGSAIFYTLNGEPYIYAEPLALGFGSLFRDFGPGVIVRDISVAQGRYVVVTGGQVTQYVDSLGTMQRDHGGDLHLIDTGTGNEITVVLAAAFARRPVLSPDGHEVVFERYPYVINVLRAPDGTLIGVDTVVSHVADLWSLQWP